MTNSVKSIRRSSAGGPAFGLDFIVPMVSKDPRGRPSVDKNQLLKLLIDHFLGLAQQIELNSTRRRFPFFKKSPSKEAIYFADLVRHTVVTLSVMENLN